MKVLRGQKAAEIARTHTKGKYKFLPLDGPLEGVELYADHPRGMVRSGEHVYRLSSTSPDGVGILHYVGLYAQSGGASGEGWTSGGGIVCVGSHFDDTFWTPAFNRLEWGGGVWTGVGFSSLFSLNPLGGWEVGYQPSKLIITLTDPPDEVGTRSVGVFGTGGDPLPWTELPYNTDPTSFEIDLDWEPGWVISSLSFTQNASPVRGTISCIQFVD